MAIRVLLDENMARMIVGLLSPLEVVHQEDLGWKGLQNGELLTRAELEFDILLTVDKQMRFQQNIAKRDISLLVLDIHPPSADNQIACAGQVVEMATVAKPGQIYVIDGPNTARRPQG